MISIIIVNHNTRDLLRRCLDSVRGQSFKDIEIIVVDNASTDDSVEMVARYYPEVRLIRNATNLLFCRAQNQGISVSKGEFILSLNSDCVLDKGYLKEALGAINIDARIGLVSGKILRMDKKTLDSTGLFLGRNRKAIERGYGKKDRGQHDVPGYVFGVSGACAFFRRGMLEDIKDGFGYFDERFGMYYEDLDLCWRAQKKGWKAYYTPKAIAYHVRGGTAVIENRDWPRPEGSALPRTFRPRSLRHHVPRNDIFRGISDELRKRYIRNRYRCMKKNDTLWGIAVNLPFILLYELKIIIYIVVKYVMGELMGGYTAILSFPRKRESITYRR